jgi:tRNA(Ile)-lysidine synthase
VVSRSTLSVSQPQHWVVAVSGGLDSTVLLHRLSQVQGLRLTAAYVDHGWRRPPEEVPALLQQCRQWGIPLVVLQNPAHLPKTETAARTARYEKLTGLVSYLGADALATAHHADDQVETLLFRLFRGTGLEGLRGIQPEGHLHGVRVVRPLLSDTRQDLLEYAQTHQLTFFEDPSNADTQHHRNFIRQDVLPLLQSRFPQVTHSLMRLSELAEGDWHIIENALNPLWEQCHTAGVLNTQRLLQLDEPYQRRLIKRYLESLGIETDYDRVARVLNQVQQAIPMVSIDDTRFLFYYRNQLHLQSLPPKTPEESADVVRFGETRLPGLNLTLQMGPYPADRVFDPENPNDNPFEVALDLSAFRELPLTLRTRRPGDRIHALGMDTPMHLKNYLINKHIPRFERDRIPLLVCGRNVLWAIGVGISDNAKVTQHPTHLISVRFENTPALVPTQLS